MKKTNKKGYIPFKKTIIPAITIIMLVVAALLLIYTIDSKIFDKGRKEFKFKYTMRVLYLVMNEDEVPADITMEKTFSPDTSEYPEGILTTSSSVIPLTKKGDYLYADLDEFTHEKLLLKETDYVFAKMNNNGEVIDGCEYDKKTNTIKVPISYFENEKLNPIQVEIQTLMKKDDFNNLDVTAKVKKYITKNVKTSNTGSDQKTIINVGKFGSNDLSKENIHVYLNNSNIELNENSYEVIDNKLRVFISPLQVRYLDVKIDYSMKKAKAGISDETSDPESFKAIQVDQPINFPDGYEGTFSLPINDDVRYCSNESSLCFNSDLDYRMTEANWSYTYFPIAGINDDTYQPWDDNPWDETWRTYTSSGLFDPAYTYRIYLATFLDALQSGLSGSIEGSNTSWIAFYCQHISYEYIHDGDDMNFRFKVKRPASGNSIIIYVESTNRYQGQTAHAFLRFEWPQQKGFKIQKIDKKGRAVEGLHITAFNKDNHDDKVTKATGPDGVATFENMTEDAHYYFYEDCNDDIAIDGVDYPNLAAADIECTYPDIDHYYDGGTDVTPAGSGYTPTEDYQTAGYGHLTDENLAGLRVKKMDGSGNAIEGLTMHAINTSDSTDVRTAVTGSDGIATFSNLTKGVRYKFYEDCSSTVTVNGNQGTLENLDINCTYYNSARSYGGTSNGFLPSVDYRTEALVEMVDAKYRYCAVAHKTKGTTHKAEPGATLRLQVASGVCDKGQIDTSIVTGSDGYVQFTDLGHCNSGGTGTVSVTDAKHLASLIGDASRSITLIRSTVKVSKSGGLDYRGLHYNEGAEIAITDADWNSYKSYVTETCNKNSATAIEFEDKGYLLYWEKQNQSLKSNGQPTKMANVRFNVKKGNTTIRVKTTKANYTDIENQTKSCYEYTEETGNNTTTELVSDANGMVCIYNFPLEENYTITEVATTKYENSSITLRTKEKFSEFSSAKYDNYEYLIDWTKREVNNRKSSNSNGLLANTKFKVTSGNTTIKTKQNKETVYDNAGNSRSCYVVDLITASNNTREVFESDANGYTCIIGLDKGGNYTITETDPSKFYAYAEAKAINQTSKLKFDVSSGTIYQCPTEVKITKTTTELSGASDAYKKYVYEELQKLTFNILDSNGRVLSFKYNSTSGKYEYVDAINELRGTHETGDTRVRLLPGVNIENTSLSNMNLDMYINYLPEGTYTIVEVSSKSCGNTSSTASSGSNCTCNDTSSNPNQATPEEAECSNMGYGHIANRTFTVTDNNNGDSVTCDKADNSVKVPLTNRPTVVNFTKKDFYGYYTDDTVKFENDEEISAFDNIVFKVRKKSTVNLSGISSLDSNVYEWFLRTAAGEYRHDVLGKCSSEGQTVGGLTCTQILHTSGGNMKLTHLCKCDDYYIEEVSVPDGSVFILPKLEGDTCQEGYMKVNNNGKLECHPIKAIKVCDCDDETLESSPPVIIEDLPTKQVFIKKDLKYNTIITDQRTTFELFLTTEDAANAGRSCNPYDATSKANDCIQVYFSERTVLADEADGSYSYRMIQDASVSNKIKYLHVDPNTGKLIFRYLPSYITREYVLMETKAPRGYDLPSGEKSVTRFRVVNDTVNVEVSNVPNKPSKAIIGKYDVATGKLIPGFKFKIYKVNNYDENLTAMRQSMTPALEFKTIRDGSYEYREIFDTSLITTCIDKEGSPCSDITNTLVDSEYINTNIASTENNITIKEGQALIQYLDTDAYYVVEEVEAPAGYKLPERESDRFTVFYVPEGEEVTKETKIYNTETYFTFFKYDEFNNLKDGATFKLQKLNNDKIYEDVAVEDVSTEDTKMYKVLSTSENYDITTINGQATIYRLTEGQYRILETKAPEGYELPKKTYNVVTFLVDKKGHTYGSNIIANKKKTERIQVVPEAQAELVVNIQTGQKVIKYGLIIAGILGLISLLIFIRKKISK